MPAFDYHEPESVEAAIDLLTQHGDEAHLMAGGTSVVLLMSQGLMAPGHVVSLRRLARAPGPEGLAGIRPLPDGGLELGALTTLRTVEAAPEVTAYDVALVNAIHHVASVRIRAQATIGGNLAHADPAQDPPPALLVLDAELVARGPTGERVIPIDRFFVDVFETALEPDEVLTAVRLPPRRDGARSVYIPFLPRSRDDYATVSVAVSLRQDAADGSLRDVRVALGSVAATPVRARSAEALLEGQQPDRSLFEAAAEAVDTDIDPVDDIRGSASYRRQMARVWTRRALESVTGAAPAEPAAVA